MEILDGFKKYPTFRDHPFKNCALWIKGRDIDDACGPYWRIQNHLYDLTDFIAKHPGGKQWIEVTRGHDVTEYFETFHLNPAVRDLLSKYYRRPADGPRIAPYTFEPNGFYSTLKKRAFNVLNKLASEEKESHRNRVRSVHNTILFTLIVMLLATGWTRSRWMAALCGVFVTLTYTCSHNFAHQKDNWRRYCMDFAFYSSYEFRISHCMSHHVYTNTVNDLECSFCEPLVDTSVYKKSLFTQLISTLTFPVLSQLTFFVGSTRSFLLMATKGEVIRLEGLLALSEVVLFVLMGVPFVKAIELWLIIVAVSGYFLTFTGLIAGHQLPDLYHAGDGEFAHGNDWGLAQLDAVRDRRDINGNLFFELTLFGSHALHHMFPTVDHGLLEVLRPAFEETCKEFNLPTKVYQSHMFYDQWDCFVDYFRQVFRTVPRKLSP